MYKCTVRIFSFRFYFDKTFRLVVWILREFVLFRNYCCLDGGRVDLGFVFKGDRIDQRFCIGVYHYCNSATIGLLT